jgi:hypothetical protein
VRVQCTMEYINIVNSQCVQSEIHLKESKRRPRRMKGYVVYTVYSPMVKFIYMHGDMTVTKRSSGLYQGE